MTNLSMNAKIRKDLIRLNNELYDNNTVVKAIEFLKFMKKFHHYSFNNRLLIFAQNPEATRVAGYCTWKELGRGVKSNPKKIFILKSIPCKIKKEKQNELLENDDETITLMKYGWTIVYDISDTYIRENQKEVPLLMI